MSAISDETDGSFRLSQLIYDTRYRSLTIQAVAAILLVMFFSWLIWNTIYNLQELGKDFNFGFLSNRAGYDINQRLIDYSSDSTHARAALVGILNTLLVAFLGCLLATFLGVVAGVLRLSNNWVVAKLMAVYVEGFRNVPLLLWILLIFAVMTESMPQPREFRGEEPSASMMLGDSVAVTNRGIYIPALSFTRSLSGNEAVAGQEGVTPVSSGLIDWILILGVLAASVVAIKFLGRWADKTQEGTGDRPVTWYYTLGLLVVPVGIVLLALGATLVSPFLKGFNFSDGTHLRNSLVALWLALSLYTGAFIAEIVRAGILAISKGQSEAAFALGIRPSVTMRQVILPQLTKNSSLALAVGYMDVRSTLGGITINQTGRELEGILLLGSFYLILSLVISGSMNIYNQSIKLKER